MRPFFKPLRGWLAMPVVVALAGLELVAFAAVPSAANAAVPSNPAWKSSAAFGAWHNGGFIVYNNEWNTAEAGPQTIWANSYQNWGVSSKQANTTSVKTYPSVQKNYSNTPYTSLAWLRSTFTESMPSAPNLDAEAAYDVWLNNYNIEVMIWVDNHRQAPAGSLVAKVKIYGQTFAVWQSGRDMYSFVLSGKRETSGKVHILSALRWLVHHGYLSRSVTMTQVDFGWEIASSTNLSGSPMDFTMTRYSLSRGLKG